MDALMALEALEGQEKQKKAEQRQRTTSNASNRSTGKKGKVESGYVSEGARKTSRSRSVPPPIETSSNGNSLEPPLSTAKSERAPSVASGRRISFADTPKPPVQPIWIPTIKDSLASGFVYDERLNKYGVSKKEWADFSSAIAQCVQIKKVLPWALVKNDVIKQVRKDLRYDTSDLNRTLKEWNRLFRRQGFSVGIELPTGKGEEDKSEEYVGDSKEERKLAKEASKRFRVSVQAEGNTGSAYTLASLNRSVSGEAAKVGNEPDPEISDEVNGEGKDPESKDD